jgi:ATP-dependent RNA helicase RhlE
MSFSSLGLSPELLSNIATNNYESATPIQKEAIPKILDGKDVLGIAQTGSGKTASFVLPILDKFQSLEKVKNRHVSALVLVPTRELAIQVDAVFQQFDKNLPKKNKSLAVYGGVSINPQMIGMQGIDILVATPGRLLELIENKALSLSEVQVLVIDEADKMLNLGFREEMKQIFKLLPKKRQNLLFSATLSEDLNAMNAVLLNDPHVVKVEEKEENLDLIQQIAYTISDEKKGPFLRFLIKENNMNQVLVFTSSVHRADNVTTKLNNNGINARAIHSKKSQGARNTALNMFKSGKINVLVATDLIGRGIDIQFLPYIINYELPRSPKDYVHRIGRTGRANNPGEAISLITPDEEHHFKIIQKKIKKQVEIVDGNEYI